MSYKNTNTGQCYIYILRSIKDKKLYVGYTTNLEKRLKKHKYGEVTSTKKRRPFELVYKELCISRYEGRKREKFLKSLYGYREKYRLIKQYNQNITI